MNTYSDASLVNNKGETVMILNIPYITLLHDLKKFLKSPLVALKVFRVRFVCKLEPFDSLSSLALVSDRNASMIKNTIYVKRCKQSKKFPTTVTKLSKIVHITNQLCTYLLQKVVVAMFFFITTRV